MHRWHSSGEKTRTQPMNLSTNWYQFVVESWYHGIFIMCVNSEYIYCVYNAF